MKNSISNLGTVLSKKEQSTISGGNSNCVETTNVTCNDNSQSIAGSYNPYTTTPVV